MPFLNKGQLATPDVWRNKSADGVIERGKLMASLHEISVGQQTELWRILAASGMDAGMAESILRKPQVAAGWVLDLQNRLGNGVDLFAKYGHLLLPLDQQLVLLREYNVKYWGGVLDEDIFAEVDTTSDHFQRVEDLEILHIQFKTDKDTFEKWVTVIEGENPSRRDCSLTKGYKIRRLAENTRKYSVGIHRVHINLVAHWDPKNYRSVNDVRSEVMGTLENLAHGEVFAAYALHSGLLQKTDGTNLPFFDGAGYEVKLSDDSVWKESPYISRGTNSHIVFLQLDWPGNRSRDYSVPVVW